MVGPGPPPFLLQSTALARWSTRGAQEARFTSARLAPSLQQRPRDSLSPYARAHPHVYTSFGLGQGLEGPGAGPVFPAAPRHNTPLSHQYKTVTPCHTL